ncbi:MAG: hypothetical protein DMG06_07240 [Acidobacteria bacterium]|nr:MAG: hypothetical protein DMG06_07240 [Acidobacteriota bacterium]
MELGGRGSRRASWGKDLLGATARQEARPPDFFTPSLDRGIFMGRAASPYNPLKPSASFPLY